MTKQTTPATPLPSALPWYEDTFIQDNGVSCKMIRSVDHTIPNITDGICHMWGGSTNQEANAAYIVHAANAYPKAQKLAEVLKRIADDDGYWGKFAREALAEWEKEC